MVLDGFPKTVEQAKKLDGLLEKGRAKIDKVLEFKISEELSAERLIYNVYLREM